MKASAAVTWMLAVAGWATAGWLYQGRDGHPRPAAGTGTIASIPSEPSRAAGNAEPYLEKTFRDWSANPAFAGASIGFCLLDESGAVVFASPLAATALCPASALKTVTTAAALEVLGMEFRFTTTVFSDRPVSPAGVLEGDLLLVGSGDPTFSTEDLDALVKELSAKGLKQVNGKLRASGPAFPDPVSDHWNWGDIGNGYGAGAYGINLDHNRYVVRFQAATREGDPATLLNRDAPTQDTRWVNQVLTGPSGSGDQVVAYSEPFGRTITLRGTVPLGEKNFPVSGATPDPAARVREVLQARLEAAGVKFLGRDLPARNGRETLATHSSAALPEIIDHLHKVSDNLEAQCLFFTIGLEKKTDPGSAVRRYWESRGVEFNGLRLIDGSGLARANMIRPLDLARVNHAARHGPYGERFRQSLTTYADGKVRAKLGAMSGVKTDVGFITMADGREFTFALMANGLDPSLSYWLLRNELLLSIAR